MIDPAFTSWAEAAAGKAAYVQALPDWVFSWMTWMRFVFFSSIWFAWKHNDARLTLATGFLSLQAAILVAYFVGWGLLWGITHLVLWTPLLLYVYINREPFSSGNAHSLWQRVLIGTIIVSLIFDIRDLILYFL